MSETTYKRANKQRENEFKHTLILSVNDQLMAKTLNFGIGDLNKCMEIITELTQ